VLWACGVTVLGYVLGGNEWVKGHVDLVLVLVVLVSILPLIVEYLRHRKDASLNDNSDPA